MKRNPLARYFSIAADLSIFILPRAFFSYFSQLFTYIQPFKCDSTLKLRVYIQGGGCSGFQYGFAFANEVEEGDVEVVNQDVVLLIDPLSYQYLVGAEIDYVNDLQGEQFVIRNPNATTTCGCGNSFSA